MKKPDFSLDALEPYFDKIEKLPKMQRTLISCILFALVGCAFFFLLLKPQAGEIEKYENNLRKLEKELNIAKRNAKDLKKFQNKIKEAETQFKIVMKSLPEKEEIPSLLTSISDSGRDSGLEFVLFQPKGEISKDFYAELPVEMTVKGKYHNVALFFDKVARLSRVVNIRDIVMKPQKEDNALSTSCIAVTYKFIESSAKGGGKNKRKIPANLRKK
jgi:type IV pilus assembly protein PilO